MKTSQNKDDLRKIVRERYAGIATGTRAFVYEYDFGDGDEFTRSG